MAQARIKIAKPDIIRLFEELPRRILRRTELSQILSKNRKFWRLAQSETVNSFIDFLLAHAKLKRAVFEFPNRTETRYTWGDVPFYELLMSIKPNAYFSHYSAMYLHDLTDQIPKTIYLNDEQTPKPAPVGQLVQERIDGAFRRPQRASSNHTKFGGYTICLLNGKSTEQLGVIQTTGPDGATVRVTGPERTLIDIAVRPNYSGGIFEVLEAYRRAHDMISNRGTAYLFSFGLNRGTSYLFSFGLAHVLWTRGSRLFTLRGLPTIIASPTSKGGGRPVRTPACTGAAG